MRKKAMSRLWNTKCVRALLRLTLTLAAAVLLTAVCFAGNTVGASRTSSQIYLNDTQVYITGYTIGGNNYFKIRDLAWALRDTTSQFDLGWNAEARRVEVLTRRPYSGEQPENGYSWYSQPVQAALTDALLTVDGQTVDNVTAYGINGNNYYKLRDLSGLLSFSVQWLEESGSICIYTMDEHTLLADGTAGSTRQMNTSVSTDRWSQLLKSYLYEDGGDVFYAVDGEPSGVDKAVAVDIYDKETLSLQKSFTVPVELDTFGGFFAGEKYNYMVFGQNNTEENDNKEVIRVVKYDRDFNRLDAASVKGGESYTIEPFDAGSLKMAENGDELVIHTSRKRYKTEDGLNHQSQLTICLNTNTMQATNSMGRFQENHVSHSFNQFVIFDDGRPVLVDHGDAYPRSVVLNRASGSKYSETDLMKIPGSVGANCTGVTVGGFEASDSNYLVAINTIDHSKVTAYDSYNMTGLTLDERDIVLLVSPRGGSGTQQVRLTDYIGKGRLGSTPYLVKLNENRFLVLWEEFVYEKDTSNANDTGTAYVLVDESGNILTDVEYFQNVRGAVDNGVRYVEVDGSGKVLTEVGVLQNARLSYDCQPVLLNGAVTWYVNVKAGRMFYQINP